MDRCILADNLAFPVGLLSLHEAVRKREPDRPEAVILPEELMAQFRAADPTRNGSCLSWLLRTYVTGGYLLEDLGKAYDTLQNFARLREQLPVTATIDGETRNPRKLGSHMTLASLWSFIAPLVEAERLAKEDCSGEQDDTDRERALSQSRVIHRSNRMVVGVPMTEEASCWWGQGTQWCTAARNNNAFENYYSVAPLIVICLRKSGDLPARKLQLHINSAYLQFMDENDAWVSPEIILERWQDLEALLHWAVTQHGGALDYVPKALCTEALCTAAVCKNGWVLNYVPEHLRTEAMCLAAVTQSGWAIYHIPEHLRTEAICLTAVRQNGWALHYVPEPLCTEAICLTAVGNNGLALEYVPIPLRTEMLCTVAVGRNGQALKFVPKRMRTEAMCRAAVAQNGCALQYVLKGFLREALYLVAVGVDGKTLQYVPKHLRTEAMCRAAIGRNGQVLEHVPERYSMATKILHFWRRGNFSVNLRTEAICLAAVTGYGLALQWVPKPLRTPEIYLAAVGRNGEALEYVPKHLRTEMLCTVAVGENGRALQYVPLHLLTEVTCLAAIKQHAWAINYVPEHLRTKAMCLAAVVQNSQEYTPSSDLSNSHESALISLENIMKNPQS